MTDVPNVAVTADLSAPAAHVHDDVEVPMQRSVTLEPTFDGDRARFRYVTTYTCHQCRPASVVRMTADVDLRHDAQGRANVTWHHGPVPD